MHDEQEEAKCGESTIDRREQTEEQVPIRARGSFRVLGEEREGVSRQAADDVQQGVLGVVAAALGVDAVGVEVLGDVGKAVIPEGGGRLAGLIRVSPDGYLARGGGEREEEESPQRDEEPPREVQEHGRSIDCLPH